MHLFSGYLSKKVFLEIGIAILGIASVLIAVVTYYGQNAGNFVMQIEEEAYRRNIVLSNEPEFISPTPRLLSNALVDVRDITYDWIDIESAVQTDGNFEDPKYKYVAYTFYIKNEGFETCDLAMTMDITNLVGPLDAAVRIIIIDGDGNETMYMKRDDPTLVNEHTYTSMPENIKEFAGEKQVVNETINTFLPGQINKYTVIIYLEGQDPECNDNVLGGKIKFRLVFTVLNDDE